MRTLISLVRHGQVDNPHDRYYGRARNYHLSNVGRTQALAAAIALKHRVVAAIYTSPMERARETAEIIASYQPGAPVYVSELLIEVHSCFDGRPMQEIRDRHYDIYSGVPAEFEQPKHVLRRIREFIEEVRHCHPGQQVIAVTHGDLIAFQIAWMEESLIVPGKRPERYPALASVTTLGYRTEDKAEVPDYEYWDPGDGRVVVGPRRRKADLPLPLTAELAA